MAETNQADTVMLPEQRAAALVVRRRALTVPVDIEALAARIADIEEASLPVRSDAIVITNTETGGKPRIIINNTIPHTRRRFTLAHEVGHLLIPWHAGTFACDTSGTIRLGDQLYKTSEAEANRFASELLMPREWLQSAIGAGLSAATLHHLVSESAQVSLVAAAITLVQALPPGHLFAITDKLGFVQYSGASEGTAAAAPTARNHLDTKIYSKKCLLYEAVHGPSQSTTHWWKYGAVAAVAPVDDHRTGGEILKSMINSTVNSPEQAKFFTQSIAGIIGSANSQRKLATAEELLGILHQTFLIRPEIAAIMAHPDFDTFLIKKAEEIAARRSAGRGKRRPTDS